ncbi:Putative sigma-54 modulation protein [Jeotgalicoccus aerolatus]|uniref:Ribosome hibernation promoting factor n=1 Tax=Jeotgalicoccus aerolatus TaxID=709510 RepID=A0ABS4HKI9_9STAP|nr:ribosome-associated translation inhibitor RaiA [Jeotgalicoccus aerolatus]MBP1951149.1 ribosomal subunit interface protein [Jeotgalicoccus aerolatus]GGD99866.1 ribosome hibernation promotion factor [Jeotgalicoccus aerolatus]CAD2077870.1 Putative sigma-54 modulation protein [Jeotgalicoccus aerolatus]HJG32398.1 ribosome-associated translation inhibitor RaiA [Jeotgalicoccus aerolatus]
MIRVEIRGENIEVTDAIREHIEDKVAKLERYFNDVPNTHAHVNIKVRNNKRGKVEITIPMKDLTLRAEEGHDDLYAAVDLVIDKLERQIRKHKTKINRKFREKNPEADFFNASAFENGEKEDSGNGDDIAIFRSKEFTLKPMDSEEAVLQMNMLGHDFFVFNDRETDGTSIVYRRKDGKYGLIETN